MEPLSALSVAAAVAQFVDFGLKIAGNAREIYGSLSGATEENQHLEAATRMTQQLAKRLVVTSPLGVLNEEETMLNDLVTECRSLSTQLLNLLNKIKVRDPTSRRQVTWAAFRSKLHEGEKVRLRQRLDDCQLRLDRVLSVLSRSEIREQLECLILAGENSSHNLTVLQAQVKELHQGSELTSLDFKARDQLRDILGFSQSLCLKAAQRRVLSLLAFPGMHDRVDTVEKAHKETYGWIFGDTPNAERDSNELPVALFDDTARKTVDTFVEWLSSGTGMYHIAGKLGSGKSTLTKFLAGHDQVRKELQKWAGDKKLVIASFFFWRRGTPLQRSLSGLFRSLLHDALQQRPDLIPEVLPEAWSEAVGSPAWHSPSPILEDSAVKTAFSRLLQCPSLYDHSKFCFFIDGLDEYEETFQDDFKAMLQLLAIWTQAAPNDIKLCVSSREYNVFLNFFSAEKRMRLQDLTLADMKHYVRERLQELHQEDLDRIVQVITDKANGIFLWVALVVKSVRARLEDGCGASMIEDEVNSLPDELEGLFQHLLASINKSYRKKAYQTFAIIQALPINDERPVRLSLLAYSFLEDYDVGSEFAQRPNPSLFPLTETARCQRENAARKRLNAHCQGLVEVDYETYLRHTHRSVVEFLAQHLKKQTPTAGSALAGFQPAHAVSQLILAELRCRPRDSYWMGPMVSSSPFLRITMRIRAALVAVLAAGLDVPPYSYLEALRFAANAVIPQHLGRDVMMQKQPPQFASVLYFWDPASVLNECASLGMHEYLEYVTSADPSTIDNNDKVASLAFFDILGVFGNWCQRHGVKPSSYPFGGLAVLLRRGICPNAAIHTNPWTRETHLRWGATLWEHLIFYLASGDSSLASTNAGTIIQEFLEQGANPDIRIALVGGCTREPSTKGMVSKEYIKSRWSIERWKRQQNGPQPRLAGSNGGIARPAIKFTFGRGQGNATTVNSSRSSVSDSDEFGDKETHYYNFFVSKGGEICFEDFVEFCNFENKDVILGLCARNRLALGASTETRPEAENEGQNLGVLHKTNTGGTEQAIEEVQDSWEADSGVELATPTETKEAAGNGPALPEQEQSKLEYLKHKHKHEEPGHRERKKQRFKQGRQTQTLYQRLRKSRVVDVALAILVALVLSQLLHFLS